MKFLKQAKKAVQIHLVTQNLSSYPQNPLFIAKSLKIEKAILQKNCFNQSSDQIESKCFSHYKNLMSTLVKHFLVVFSE